MGELLSSKEVWSVSDCTDIALLVIVRRHGCLLCWFVTSTMWKSSNEHTLHTKSFCKKYKKRNFFLKIMIKLFEIVRFWLLCVLVTLLQKIRIFWCIYRISQQVLTKYWHDVDLMSRLWILECFCGCIRNDDQSNILLQLRTNCLRNCLLKKW